MTKSKNIPPDIDEQLKIAIRDCGMSVNKLAEKSGVPQPTIARYLRGQDMRMSGAKKIAKVLGLELKPKKGR